MKKLIIILLSILGIGAFSQATDTISTKSKITDVTVFFSGAQVTRQVEYSAIKGEQLLLIDRLPLGLNKQSLQVNEIMDGKIISVKHQTGLAKEKADLSIADGIDKEIEAIEIKIKENIVKKAVFDLEERFILENSKLGGTKGSSIAEIKVGADFFRQKLNEIKSSKLTLLLELDNLKEERKQLNKDLAKIKNNMSNQYSQVYILIDNERAQTAGKFTISYYVKSAAWEPNYDFRVKEIGSPLDIDYNANLYQNTGEDWKNVSLTLSTSDPSLTSDKPTLNAWYIDKRPRKNYKPEYVNTGRACTLKGKLLEAGTYEPIPFANVVLVVGGTQIGGTSTDFDGNYVIKPVPPGTYDLVTSSVGYQSNMITSVVMYSGKITFLDVEMESGAFDLEAVEVMAYSVPLIQKDRTTTGATVSMDYMDRMPNRNASAIATRVGGVYSEDGQRGSIRGARSEETVTYINGTKVIGGSGNSVNESTYNFISTNYLSNEVEKKLSNLEYEIKTPYTIPSDGKDYTLKIKEVKVPVDYVYYIIPKLEEDAFLTAQIPKWNELDLLSGNSSIYYQGTFIGESDIDATYSGDTLDVSLGRDRDILISRKGNKEKLERKILGRNIKETLSWDIEIKNNKTTAVNIILEDQFPLAENKSIEIELLEISGAKADDKTGKLTWEFTLEPNVKKTLNITYTVKYPSYTRLYMD